MAKKFNVKINADFYICANKRTKRQILADLKYSIYDEYPKGDNSEDYRLGNYLNRELVMNVL